MKVSRMIFIVAITSSMLFVCVLSDCSGGKLEDAGAIMEGLGEGLSNFADGVHEGRRRRMENQLLQQEIELRQLQLRQLKQNNPTLQTPPTSPQQTQIIPQFRLVTMADGANQVKKEVEGGTLDITLAKQKLEQYKSEGKLDELINKWMQLGATKEAIQGIILGIETY